MGRAAAGGSRPMATVASWPAVQSDSNGERCSHPDLNAKRECPRRESLFEDTQSPPPEPVECKQIVFALVDELAEPSHPDRSERAGCGRAKARQVVVRHAAILGAGSSVVRW